jgi:hypothetical protein
VLRLPGFKVASGIIHRQANEEAECPQPDSMATGSAEGPGTGDGPGGRRNEEKPDPLLQKFNVSQSHRLYPFLRNSKFFIIKSANEKNFEVSQRNEEWATTTFNQNKLDGAFRSCDNVILFFSANKSAHFQGMAKMISGLTGHFSREWQNDGPCVPSMLVGMKLGPSFKVKWLVCSKMPFTKICNLKNPLNNNEPIKKARDTTVPAWTRARLGGPTRGRSADRPADRRAPHSRHHRPTAAAGRQSQAEPRKPDGA